MFKIPDPQLSALKRNPRNMLVIYLLAVLVPAVQAITAYDPIIQYFVPYTAISTSFTRTYTVTKTATLTSIPSTVTPYSTSTSTNRWDLYFTWIKYHVSSEDVPTPWATLPSPTFNSDYPTYTVWYEQTVLTAPPYCSSTWTHTSSRNVNPPTEIRYQLKPTSTITSIVTRRSAGIELPTTTLTLILTPSAIVRGATSTPPIETPTASWRLSASCKSPAPAITGPGAVSTERASGSGLHGTSDIGGNRSGSGWGDRDVLWYGHRTKLKTFVIAICAIIGCLLLFGFVENYLWFRRMMIGKSALRLGTVSWVLISLWGICLIRKSRNRTPDQQKILRQRWNAMGGGEKWNLWWKWGFRWRYPEALLGKQDGPVPGVEDPPLNEVTYQPPPPPPPGAMDAGEKTAATSTTTNTTPAPVQSPYPPPQQQQTPSYGFPPPPPPPPSSSPPAADLGAQPAPSPYPYPYPYPAPDQNQYQYPPDQNQYQYPTAQGISVMPPMPQPAPYVPPVPPPPQQQ
ncbi:hypothetical protein EX30DRAFT_370981 [Ascodesmis nigricans]|uniref:Mid2 domain-containing protein n=1 Tax=Ascodesmis nigricans TaxID=341454 RepID=A0A4S2N006_9PEZI|nr:hypothetical protein EX30DRAFT_370981 [Ascodesmis nigricans]